MKMQNKQFRIGELAKKLNVERFVIRFWEKEFNLKPIRSHGGQRFYEQKDFDKFKQIKKLLYNNGFTINGARQQLKANKSKILGSHKTTIENHQNNFSNLKTSFIEKTIQLKQKLSKLKQQL